MLAGANVDVTLAGGLKNTGTIAGRQLVSIDAGRIEHLGGSISGHALDPGFVVRQIIPDGNGGFSVSTTGWGTGSSPMFNSNTWAAGVVWGPNTDQIGRQAVINKWPWDPVQKQPRCSVKIDGEGRRIEVCQ